MVSRAEAEKLDRSDDLGRVRDEFALDDERLIYLDGNSLGRPPAEAIEMVTTGLETWRQRLVGGWREWIELPVRAGEALAPLLGAGPGQVIVVDQTSINLYKLAVAGLAASGRSSILTTATNFPSDIYVLSGVADAAGGRLILADSEKDLASRMDESVGLVSLSHVDFKTSRLAPMQPITELAHANGSLILWDLSHSAGVLPIELDGAGVDLAVGCTYKYLNGGPGAPAFLYVAERHHQTEQPIRGWFGHADMFGFANEYAPADGIARFQVGTPPVLSMLGALAGIEGVARAGVTRIRAKSLALTDLMMAMLHRLADQHAFEVSTPDDPAKRGGHVGLTHQAAYQISQALIARGVIPDYRAPDILRLAPSPLYTRFVDVWDAVDVLGQIMDRGAHLQLSEERRGVT